MLLKASNAVKQIDLLERRLRNLESHLEGPQATEATGKLKDELAEVTNDFNEYKRQLTVELERMIKDAHIWKGYGNDAISD